MDNQTGNPKSEESFLGRLIREEQELKLKIHKLDSFIKLNNLAGLPPIQAELLKVQLQAMKTYLTCLEGRLYWLENEQESN